jgi:uncharacterized protein YxeA
MLLMKKILCLVIAIMLMLACVGCSSVEYAKEEAENVSMFVLIEQGHLTGYSYNIVYHKETKIMYAIGYHATFTVMLDADGKPLLWEG